MFDPLMRLKLIHVKSMMEKLEKAIKSAENEEDLTRLLQEKIKLHVMKMKISKFFGSTII